MKKITLLVPQMRHGGAERVVSRLSKLKSADYEISIVVFDDTVVTYDIGCEMTCLNIKPTQDNNFIKKAYNVIKRVISYSIYKKRHRTDLTYSFGDTANIINILSLGKDKRVISIRGYKRLRLDRNSINKYIFKPISKFIFFKADNIVSVSKVMTQGIIENYKISPEKITTSYNGYDINEIKVLSKNNCQDSVQDEINIITAGTFRDEKGYWHLVKAFYLASKKYGDIKLSILGADSGGQKEKVRKLAADFGIDNKIEFLGYQENPFSYFSNSSIYVLPSISEGFPNAMVEAMACGLPIVATDCKSGPREILAPNSDSTCVANGIELAEYGILVPPLSKNPNYNFLDIEECDENLAEALSKLVSNKSLREKYADLSLHRAESFSIKNWVLEQEKILLG